ncbi:hypothetical protein [Paenibacillus sp. FSL H7-0331]|uniref:hypothetical protein n=1 Tax=Paenibacillus sp. FSL H7-0331 TaxID=1920421 RepID=UPI00096C84B9|nr:hypothetical protein [Paenibacillus sp. FSL H7-0331]OMF06812.1 hypothetical protein BK127_30910 [Paenibacillus sp. FSL H7-0331]
MEIVSGGQAAAATNTGDVTTKIYDKTTGKLRDVEAILAEEEAIRKLAENTNITVKSEFIEDQGNKVFHAYDMNGMFMGQFTDEDDMIHSRYRIQKMMSEEIVGASSPTNSEAPPIFSNGWMSDVLLKKIFKYTVTVDSSTATIKSVDGKELARITLPLTGAPRQAGTQRLIT